MKKYFVIGNPIKHSLSPKLHNYWFRQNNISDIYDKKLLDENNLKNFVDDLRNGSFHGANVTVPFKNKIIPFLDEVSETAKKTQSVNTIYLKNKSIIGENTDVYGFHKSLELLNYTLKNKSAFIIGAGGVSSSIIQALKLLGVNKIFVTNRTHAKAENLAKFFNDIEIVEWGKVVESDIYINVTSVGLNNQDNLEIDFSNIANKLFYDVIYSPDKTNFLKNAELNNNVIANGKMMFLYQAQAAFKIWTGIEPKVTQIEESLLDD
jgi:shikimate dehydrogenase